MYCKIIGEINKAHLLRKLFTKRNFENKFGFQQIHMLRFIYDHSDCTQADIAKYFHVSSATIAVSTKRLQKAGLIQKTVEESNLRCKRISLTEYGESEVLRIQEKLDEYDSYIFSDFTDDECELFLSFLSRMNKKMELHEGISYDDTESIESIFAELMNRLCTDTGEFSVSDE